MEAVMRPRLVVVGREDRYREWLHAQPVDAQRWIRPVREFRDLWHHGSADVEFMADWRSRYTTEQQRAILAEAQILTGPQAAMLRPFQPPVHP